MEMHKPFIEVTNMDRASALEKGSWSIIGPGGAGAQYLPTVSPHDSDIALVACDMTGAYITHDAGRSWRQFNLRHRTHSFAFHPSDPKVIYAGASGLFRSDDSGDTWKLICPNPDTVTGERARGDEALHDFISKEFWPGGIIQAIRVDPGNPEHIYIGLKSAELHVFHSIDGGVNWSELCRVDGSLFRLLYADSSIIKGIDTLYIFTDAGVFSTSGEDGRATGISLPFSVSRLDGASCGYNPEKKRPVFYITSPAGWFWRKYYSGVWKSTDLGRTWQLLNSGLDRNIAVRETEIPPSFTLISACEGDARTVYMSAHRYPEGIGDPLSLTLYYGIVKSTDEGESWDWMMKGKVNEDPINKQKGWVERSYNYEWYWIGSKGTYLMGLGTSASNPAVCYATDIGATLRTFNGGTTWEQLYSNDYPDGSVSSTGLDAVTCYGVHFDPFDRKHIAISYTDNGLFHSKDGGNTWFQSIDGISIEWGNTCYWMVFDPDVKDRAWSVWSFAHDLPRVKMFKGGALYKADGGVCRTEDGLQTWKVSNKGLPENCIATHMLLDPSSLAGKRTLYVTGFGTGVYKSTDDGYTWTIKNNGISGNLNAWRIYLLPDGTLCLLVARGEENGKEVDGALYISSDGAENWTTLSLPEGVNAPNDIAFDPSDQKRMYLACWPKIIDEQERFGGLYVTDDGGQSWRNVLDEAYHMYSVAVDPDNSSVVIAVSFESAAFRSEDAGQTWKCLGGYNFKWGHRPVFDPNNKGMLYITTFGSSVWHGPAAGTCK